MCGILGYYLKHNKEINRKDVETALKMLKHRGPDGKGIYAKNRILLGHTRLSIIDLSTGSQPMLNENSSLSITFNGEIYNYLELRKELIDKGHRFKTTSDTEVILHLYEDYGSECLKYLRGMFAFGIWDEKNQELFIARDRIGVKPLVYSEEEKGFFFASEIQALLHLNKNISRDCNLSAINYFLSLQYIPSPMTGFQAIRKLQPAHYMVIKNGKIQCMKRYWDIPYTVSNISFPDACEKLKEIITDAVKIRMRSDVPFGAFLSGGVDSSIIVAAMSKMHDQPTKTFSAGFGVKGYDELPMAKELANLYRTEHTEFKVKADAISILNKLINAFGEPFGDSSIIPTYYISKLTSNHVKVALTGDGGDETFAGYKRFYQLSFLDFIERFHLISAWKMSRFLTLTMEGIFNKKRRNLKFPFTKMDKAVFLNGVERYMSFITLFSESEKQHLYTPLMLNTKDRLNNYFSDKLAKTDGLNKYLYVEQATFLPEDILFKVDICSMLNSLECRSPLLDHKLIEFASTLPGTFKLRHRNGKFIFKKTFNDYFMPDFFKRPKIGFAAPTHIWLKGELKNWCKNEIMTNKSLSKLIKLSVAEELFNDVDSNHKKLWNLLVLSQWLKAYDIEL